MSDNVCLCPFAGEDDPCPCASGDHDGCARCSSVDRFVMLDRLGANGYVVVPRHLLTALTDAADDMVPWVEGPTFYSDRYGAALAAVVEAVGPTREDQR